MDVLAVRLKWVGISGTSITLTGVPKKERSIVFGGHGGRHLLNPVFGGHGGCLEVPLIELKSSSAQLDPVIQFELFADPRRACVLAAAGEILG